MLRVLFIGDIVGKAGRQALSYHLSEIKDEFDIDITFANLENSAAGFGFTERVYKELKGFGIDGFTSGNHVYDKKETMGEFDRFSDLVRPLNFPEGNPGVGVRYFECKGVKIALINLIGRVFMGMYDCPFRAIEKILPEVKSKASVILIDMHGEATSEKQAMGFYLDGKASAVFGTHTHVNTGDARVLPEGTAYITDVGMTGALNSVLGMVKDPIISRFFTNLPTRFKPEDERPWMINSIVMHIDPETGRAEHIEHVSRHYD